MGKVNKGMGERTFLPEGLQIMTMNPPLPRSSENGAHSPDEDQGGISSNDGTEMGK